LRPVLQPVNCGLMETLETVARMRLVGGDLALDFLNTRAGPPGAPGTDDAIAAYDDVVDWGEHVGQLTAQDANRLRREARGHPSKARRTFEHALGLRDRLDAVFRAIAAGRPPTTADIRTLRDEEAAALKRAELAADGGGYDWTWSSDRGLGRPVWPVVHAAIELLTRGQLDRIKACGGCSFLFLDESKNRSRRWCSMEDCGAAEKGRRFVARRAARRHAGS
jgi:predicted RNA-binding Zn ribbon-like protein